MPNPAWRQLTLTFPDPGTATDVATTHLAPILTDAETHELVTRWFFVRKGPWRLRYLPTTAPGGVDDLVHDQLTALRASGHLTAVTPGIYEPEIHAFGGAEAMAVAHRLWHHDSRHLLTPTHGDHPPHQRELSMILCTAMLRTAGLDRYEQGDVWARAAAHRDPPNRAQVNRLHDPVRRLLTVDAASLTHAGGALATARGCFETYTTAGAALDRLHHTGQLHRGLREILTHHVIFTWNRRGIPGMHQAALATAARDIIFGADPTTTTPAAAHGTP